MKRWSKNQDREVDLQLHLEERVLENKRPLKKDQEVGRLNQLAEGRV